MVITLQTRAAANNFLIVPKSEPAVNAMFEKAYSIFFPLCFCFFFKPCAMMARIKEEQVFKPTGYFV